MPEQPTEAAATTPRTNPARNTQAGVVMLLLALVPGALGGYVISLGLEPERDIASADIAGSEAGFARVVVTPYLASVQFIDGGSSASHDFLITTEEELLLYVPARSDLGEALADYQAYSHAEPNPEAAANVQRPWEVEGSLYVLGDYPRLTSDVPGYLIDDYAREIGVTEGRVLEVDYGPLRVLMVGGLSYVGCVLPLIALALYSFLRAFRERHAA